MENLKQLNFLILVHMTVCMHQLTSLAKALEQKLDPQQTRELCFRIDFDQDGPGCRNFIKSIYYQNLLVMRRLIDVTTRKGRKKLVNNCIF